MDYGEQCNAISMCVYAYVLDVHCFMGKNLQAPTNQHSVFMVAGTTGHDFQQFHAISLEKKVHGHILELHEFSVCDSPKTFKMKLIGERKKKLLTTNIVP